MGSRPASVVDSSPVPGSQELPQQDAETDPSHRLPAAHLIGKDLIALSSPRCHFCSPTAGAPLLGYCSAGFLASSFPPRAGKARPGSPRHTPPLPTPRCLQSPARTHCRGSTITAPRSRLVSCGGLEPPAPFCPPSQESRAGSRLRGRVPERPPARFFAGAWTQGQGLGWESKKEEAFLRSGAQFSGAEGLAFPRDGLYYLYCHVGYRGRAPPADGDPLDRSVTLRSRLYRAGGAYGPGTPELLLEGAETVSPALDPARRLWYTSVGFGGLVQLRRGERVYVNISHPDMVDYRRGKTFFGAVMVG